MPKLLSHGITNILLFKEKENVGLVIKLQEKLIFFPECQSAADLVLEVNMPIPCTKLAAQSVSYELLLT